MADEPTLWISGHLAEKIRSHGSETYPHECCGALLGRDSEMESQDAVREVLGLFPLINRRDDSPRNRFSVTAEDVREAEKAARERGLEVIGWDHLPPDPPAQPSPDDPGHGRPRDGCHIVRV